MIKGILVENVKTKNGNIRVEMVREEMNVMFGLSIPADVDSETFEALSKQMIGEFYKADVNEIKTVKIF